MWARNFGGSGYNEAYGIAVDVAGNVYTTGLIDGTTDFDPGAGTANLTAVADGDIFISKLNSAGNYVWAKVVGGTGYDSGEGIAVDASGNVYTSGSFQGTADFNPGAPTNLLTSAGGYDIFIIKLDALGNFVWAKRLGGTLDESGGEIALDAAGNPHTTGYFEGTADFDPGAGTVNLISKGAADAFVSKLDALGNFMWAKQLGGTFDEDANDIDVDANGNVYTIGRFYGTADFDPGAGTYNLTSLGVDNIYISKLNPSGTFVWALNMGDTLSDNGSNIGLDAAGNVYASGRFEGTVDFNPGAATTNITSNGDQDIFVVKLSQQAAPVQHVWNGNMDNHWGNPSNWTPASVPDGTKDVVIPSGLLIYPSVFESKEVKSLTVQSGAAVTVKTGVILKINN